MLNEPNTVKAQTEQYTVSGVFCIAFIYLQVHAVTHTHQST